MKTSIIISFIFTLFALATAIEVGVGVSINITKPLLDEEGNQISRQHKCFMRGHELEPKPSRRFVVYKGTDQDDIPYVHMHVEIPEDTDIVGERVEFHSKLPTDLSVNRTVSTPYAINFSGSEMFWKYDTEPGAIAQTGSNILYSGGFIMEEIKDTGLNYQVYKVIYFPDYKEVGMQSYLSDELYTLTFAQSHLAFSFYQCQT